VLNGCRNQKLRKVKVNMRGADARLEPGLILTVVCVWMLRAFVGALGGADEDI
jgi:hypothetical protein